MTCKECTVVINIIVMIKTIEFNVVIFLRKSNTVFQN